MSDTQSKQLKDSLHLYLGCEVEYSFTNSLKQITVGRGILTGVQSTKESMEGILYLPKIGSSLRLLVTDIKPILRPLSSMTEEHIHEIADELEVVTNNVFSWVKSALSGGLLNFNRQVQFINALRKRYFDVYGLIDAGLAIDSSKAISLTDKQSEK